MELTNIFHKLIRGWKVWIKVDIKKNLASKLTGNVLIIFFFHSSIFKWKHYLYLTAYLS